MIRPIKKSDKSSLCEYIKNKYSCTYTEAEKESRKLLKFSQKCYIKEDKDLYGVCWIEKCIFDKLPSKKINFLVDNWHLADDFIKILRWNLNGLYIIEVPQNHFLNKTLNKNGFRFIRLQNNKNLYHYKFELRKFTNYKLEDLE